MYWESLRLNAGMQSLRQTGPTLVELRLIFLIWNFYSVFGPLAQDGGSKLSGVVPSQLFVVLSVCRQKDAKH